MLNITQLNLHDNSPQTIKELTKECWENNATAWTNLARAGYDICRDSCNTPGFFSILPDISGLKGLDMGCGEGHNTRIAARRGAQMTGVDISDTFIKNAQTFKYEHTPLDITYRQADATDLPFPDNTFDFVMATMSLQDIVTPEEGIAEAYRILKPGGFFQCSITHPCFNLAHGIEWIRDENGQKTGMIVRDYFKRVDGDLVQEWIFSAAGKEAEKYPKFRIPAFGRTLSQWINTFIDTGFVIAKLHEPTVSAEMLEQYPEEYDQNIVPIFLHIQVRKN